MTADSPQMGTKIWLSAPEAWHICRLNLQFTTGEANQKIQTAYEQHQVRV